MADIEHFRLSIDKLTDNYSRFLEKLLNKQTFVQIRDNHYFKLQSTERYEPAIRNEVICMNIHPIGKYAAWSRFDGTVSVMNLQRLTDKTDTIRDVHGLDKLCHSITWNPNEATQFATVGNTSTVKIWDVSNKKTPLLKSFTTNSKMKNYQCLFSPLGQWLVVLTKSEELYLFDISKGYKLHSISTVQIFGDDELDSTYCICWSNDGTHIYLGFKSGKIAIYQLRDQGFIRKFVSEGHSSAVTNLIIDPWGRFLISSSHDSTCAFWSLSSFICYQVVEDIDGIIDNIDISSDGYILAIGYRNPSTKQGYIRFVETISLKEIGNLSIENSNCVMPRFFPHNIQFLSTYQSDKIVQFSVQDKDPITFIENEFQSRSKLMEQSAKVSAIKYQNRRDGSANNDNPKKNFNIDDKLRRNDRFDNRMHRKIEPQGRFRKNDPPSAPRRFY